MLYIKLIIVLSSNYETFLAADQVKLRAEKKSTAMDKKKKTRKTYVIKKAHRNGKDVSRLQCMINFARSVVSADDASNMLWSRSWLWRRSWIMAKTNNSYN